MVMLSDFEGLQNNIRDGCNPQPGETTLDTMTYIGDAKAKQSGVFQNRQCKLCNGEGEGTL